MSNEGSDLFDSFLCQVSNSAGSVFNVRPSKVVLELLSSLEVHEVVSSLEVLEEDHGGSSLSNLDACAQVGLAVVENS